MLAIFFNLFVAYLLTSTQVERLVPAEDDGFASYRHHGRPINKYEIAALLKPYRVAPGLIHPRGGKTADRGWNADWFDVPFRHYLGKALPGGRSVVWKPRPKKK
jgi:hypothetical protein